MSIKENAKGNVECPKCSQTFQETVARLERDPSVTCPTCGHVFAVSREVIAATVAALEPVDRAWQEIKDLERKLRR